MIDLTINPGKTDIRIHSIKPHTAVCVYVCTHVYTCVYEWTWCMSVGRGEIT